MTRLAEGPALRPSRRRALAACALVAASALAPLPAGAAPVETLRAFVRDVKSGRAAFTQTVTSADGAKTRTQQGRFEFLRPNRFRFEYAKPFEQSIVADGQKVWILDKDLNQASSRRIAQALGATPAALLAGGSLDADFELADGPARDGLEWAEATPKAPDSAFRSVRVGFRGNTLAALEIVDSFGQRSVLRFSGFEPNAALAADGFRFVPPPGVDVVEQ